jgi:lipopolysaccharide export system permease protein
VSIVLVVAYHKINQYGQSIAELGHVNPYVALWGPFALFSALILWMFYRVAYVPGGQAIGALETAFAKLSKQVRRLWQRRDRARGIIAAGAADAV